MKKNKAVINWNSSQAFNFAMGILILVIVFIMPTIFDRRLGIVFSGTKTTWMRIIGSLMLGLWATKLIVLREHRFVRTKLDWPVLSFLLGTTIATLTSISVYTSVAGFYGRYEGLTSWYLFGLFFFVITNYIKSFDQLKQIVVTVMSAATLMAVYSIIQRYALDPYMWGGVPTKERVIGTIGQPNFLAAYMLMAFFMLLSLLLFDRKHEIKQIDWLEQLLITSYFIFVQLASLFMIYSLDANNFVRWYLVVILMTAASILFSFNYKKLHPLIFNILIGFSLVVIYVCILYTQSRGGYMGFFCGTVLFALAAGRQAILNHWKKIAVLGLLIVAISGLTMMRSEYSPFARFASEVTTEKVETAEKEESKLELKGAAGSRGETWTSAFGIIADNPFFGIGPEVLKMVFPRYETEMFRFREAFHVKQDRCHNEIFDVGVTKGLVTFYVYIWLLFVFFSTGLRKAVTLVGQEKLLVAGLLAAALAFLIQNQFSFGVVAITSLFWIIWAMVMVVGEKAEDEPIKKFSWLEIPWLPIAGIIIVVVFCIYLAFLSFRGDIWFKIGKTQMQMQRFDQAVVSLEKSLSVFPYEGGTISHLGISYLNYYYANGSRQNELLDKSIKALLYGTKIDPYNADNYYMLSKIYLLLKDLNTAEKYTDIALKIDPYYAEVYYTKGLISQARGNLDLAAQDYEKAFMINPNLDYVMQRLESMNKIAGRQAETRKAFEKALDKYDNYMPVLGMMTKLYIEDGKLDKALKLTERMIKIDLKNYSGYLMRGEVYLKSGRLEAAFSDFQQVAIKDPKNISAHLALGRYFLAKKDNQRAINEFEQALRLDPNNQYAKQMLARLGK